MSFFFFFQYFSFRKNHIFIEKAVLHEIKLNFSNKINPIYYLNPFYYLLLNVIKNI